MDVFNRKLRSAPWILVLFIGLALTGPARAQTFETELEPGANYQTAQFRMWLEPDMPVRGLLVLVPGSNGDGRGQVQDERWRAFARRMGLGLVGVHFTDRRHPDMAIEHYVDCLLYTSPSPRDLSTSRMPSSA